MTTHAAAHKLDVVAATWRRTVFFVVTFLLAWFSLPTLTSLHERWLESGYSHGYAVLVIVAFLVARALRRNPVGPLAPSNLGLACLFVAALGVIAAHAGSTLLGAQLLLPVVWTASVLAIAGWRNARAMVAPLAYVYFAVPWWDAINETLRTLTVVVVSAWLRVAEVPAHIEGDRIHIPSGTFEVAGGCSGLHYVIIGMALATLSGLLHHDRWKPRLALGAAALGLALFANWLRVFIIVVAGYTTDMQHYLIVSGHYYFGWAVFLLVSSPLLLIDLWLRRAEPIEESRAPAATLPPSASEQPRAMAWVVALVLGIGVWLGQRLESEPLPLHYARPLVLPSPGGWTRIEEWRDPTRPSFFGAAAEAAARYAHGTAEVSVYVAHYPLQQQGHEVVFFANRPEGSAGEAGVRAHRSVATASGAAIPFSELEVAERTGRRIVWFQMNVAGRLTADDLAAKGWQVVGALAGRRDAQALVLSARCTSECETARRSLAEFASAGVGPLYEATTRPVGPSG